MLRIVVIAQFILIPYVSLAGGGLNGLAILYQGPIIITLTVPLILGLIICLFFPQKRWKVFKQVAVTTFVILLLLTITFLTFIFSK
jgi:hypothetical protein